MKLDVVFLSLYILSILSIPVNVFLPFLPRGLHFAGRHSAADNLILTVPRKIGS
jgi:hypothetical protein